MDPKFIGNNDDLICTQNAAGHCWATRGGSTHPGGVRKHPQRLMNDANGESWPPMGKEWS